jgi:hypothetical protein
MRKITVALALIATLVPLGTYANTPEQNDSQEAKWSRLAEQAKPGPCPVEVEVLPYIWIEPSTGIEYSALRLHCPGRDDLDEEAPSTSGLKLDRGVSASVTSAS